MRGGEGHDGGVPKASQLVGDLTMAGAEGEGSHAYHCPLPPYTKIVCPPPSHPAQTLPLVSRLLVGRDYGLCRSCAPQPKHTV